MISKADVQKLADLAHLAVDEAELETIAHEMDEIIAYVSEVTKLASEEGERERPALRNVMRDDVVKNSEREYTERLVAQFPDRDGDYLRVKKIL